MPNTSGQPFHRGKAIRYRRHTERRAQAEAKANKVHRDASLDAEARRDRKVRQLVERQKRGRGTPAAEAIKLCPFSTLLLPSSWAPSRPPVFFEPLSAFVPEIAGFVVALGFSNEDFSHEMRERILTSLRAGYSLVLFSNKAELRDYAKGEIALALSDPAGAA